MHQALWDARTQHKAKTAGEVGGLAGVALERFCAAEDDEDGIHLKRALEEGENDIEQTLDFIKANVKGLGKTGLEIFRRRVQAAWPAAFPFVDERGARSLKAVGLPGDGEGLRRVIGENWGELDTGRLVGEDEEARMRRALVLVLERVTGAELEGRMEEVVKEAAAAAGGKTEA